MATVSTFIHRYVTNTKQDAKHKPWLPL